MPFFFSQLIQSPSYFLNDDTFGRKAVSLHSHLKVRKNRKRVKAKLDHHHHYCYSFQTFQKERKKIKFIVDPFMNVFNCVLLERSHGDTYIYTILYYTPTYQDSDLFSLKKVITFWFPNREGRGFDESDPKRRENEMITRYS